MLKRKALASLKRMTVAFNAVEDDGRTSSVLLSLQHSFEMLLKAALVHNNVPVFDKKLGRSIGFEKCLELSRQQPNIKLTDAEAGTLRAIDALRDDEQHWFNSVSEPILFIHARAGVTLFDDLLNRVFRERLADSLPLRVLPISTEPPMGLDILIDQEFSQIQDLLQPGRRARNEARARIRTLLAIEGHASEESLVSEKDVDRVEKGIAQGKSRNAVFPALEQISTAFSGEGPTLTVRFDQKGPPVKFADRDSDAAAIREIDLQKKFHRSATDLAEKLNLSLPRSLALRQHLGIDDDPKCFYIFEMGSQKHPRFSDNALKLMRESMKALDMDKVWASHKPIGRGKSPRECPIEGCAQSTKN
ncbi:hypothetical protein [Streptomyces sp. ITFR-16]|uniref:hypothetical protein n=1 Tax=Streptomyces sp. ITFR-16 TaxID=3075198 RepID=UPI00288BBAC3|nr:hypothetical protein [Streptomyces sp. ITFR-16]WNI24024.1 hypothetical protein RLT58_19820 [Streptomyces sp. ITFR-16]